MSTASEPRADSSPYLDAPLLRREAGAAIDLLARYWGSLENRAVAPSVLPGSVFRALPEQPPEEGLGETGFEEAIQTLESVIIPALTHWQSPNFFAFFPANISTPSVVGELLSAGLGVQGMLWATSPACTEMETRVLDWLAGMLELPHCFLSTSANGGGVIQATASEATLAALVAGRWRAWKSMGEADRPLTLYASSQAHSSFVKAAMIAGLARRPEDATHLRLIGVDDAYAIDAGALRSSVMDDVKQGRAPCCICATVGTTSSGACDDLAAVASIADECAAACGVRPWVHVDAAYLGSACICPEFRPLLDGVEGADSLAFNPHKWMLTNFDCDCFFTRDRASLTGSMSVTPEYLRNPASESGGVIDYRDWHVPLGRRFRSLKLWLVIRHYGVNGLRAYIRDHVRMAGEFEGMVLADPRFELCAPRSASLVCFALRGADDATNKRLLDAVNATGRASLTHTVLPRTASRPARLVLRMAIGAALTTERHVRAAWDLIRGLAPG
ncbi:MAG: pyridoxal-dependent decarboxylase [Phycisphaerales bacterium]